MPGRAGRRRGVAGPVGLFTQRSFVAAAGGIALANLAFYVTLLAIPLLLHRRGIDGAEAGLILGALTMATGMFFTSRYLGSIVGASLLAGPLAPATAGDFTVLLALLAATAATGVAVALPRRTMVRAAPGRGG